MSADIIENPVWRDKEGIYADRQEAGKILASYLEHFRNTDAQVLGIPSGGIPVGLQIAKTQNISFDMIIIRKIPIPGNTEAGFGAISLEGDMVLDQAMVRQLGLSQEQIERLVRPVAKQIEERDRLFRDRRPFPELSGRTVILVDDGLASGYTMGVAAEVVRRKNPQEIIIAVPTAPARTVANLQGAVHCIICPNIRGGLYFAVANAYREWHDLDDAEVLGFLKNN